MNYNFISKIEYHGHNQAILAMVREKMGYQEFAWITFVQARSAGLKVKKGSKSVKILCVAKQEKIVNGKAKISSLVRWASVFNLEQCEQI